MAHIENSLGNITFNEFQDNIDIVKYIPTIENVSLEDLVDVLNNIDSFTISEIQSLWIVQYVYQPSETEFVFDLIQINKFKVINKGKGTYGLGGIDLTVDDLFPISNTSVNLEDIENNPQTQIYVINDLEGLTVSQYINQLDPAFEFQDVSIAPRLIKVTQIGFEADYLFLPVGGLYGLGELQTTDVDFQLLDNNNVSIISGTSNFISKFTSEHNLGNSRIFDNGTNLGIDTVSPDKDIDFGNQNDREIGVQDSEIAEIGKDLSLQAGNTNLASLPTNFVATGQTPRNWSALDKGSDGSIYSLDNNIVLIKTISNTLFSTYATGTGAASKIAVHPNGNIYLSTYTSTISMQTGGVGSFVSLGEPSRNWLGITAHLNGDVYAVDYLGDIYKQTNGTGSFSPLSQTSRAWSGIKAMSNGDVYAVVLNGDIYKQTNGTGDFIALGQTSRMWRDICDTSNGDVYAVVQSGSIYKQTGGVGSFVSLGEPNRNWISITSDSEDNLYAGVGAGGDIYKKSLSTPINGGTLKLKAGKGKGTGQSRVEIYTGETTESNSDLQVETLRTVIDEEGRIIAPTLTEALINSGDIKTLITKEYLESQIGNYIPLVGTEIGNPITGILKVEGDNGNGITSTFDNKTSGISLNGYNSTLFATDEITTYGSGLTATTDGLEITSSNPISEGLTATTDFSSNITNLSYTQKIYVDAGLATKQPLLTNPITGTGTNNRLPKFTASGVIGNSILQEVSTTVKGIAIQNVSPTNTSFGYAVLNSASLTGTSNTGFGHNILSALTTGSNNSAFGYDVLKLITNGNNNTGFGFNCLSALLTGSENSSFGYLCFNNLTSGSANVVFGVGAGRFIADGTTALTTCNQSVLLGNLTKAFANTSVNEIVIGYNAIGAGSNTATIGNTSIIDTVLRGRVNLTQYATGSRPAYVKGALIYDSSLGKLVIGGNSGWEVVTSV